MPNMPGHTTIVPMHLLLCMFMALVHKSVAKEEGSSESDGLLNQASARATRLFISKSFYSASKGNDLCHFYHVES